MGKSAPHIRPCKSDNRGVIIVPCFNRVLFSRKKVESCCCEHGEMLCNQIKFGLSFFKLCFFVSCRLNVQRGLDMLLT